MNRAFVRPLLFLGFFVAGLWYLSSFYTTLFGRFFE
jgi:hypothetical protein